MIVQISFTSLNKSTDNVFSINRIQFNLIAKPIGDDSKSSL